MDLPNVFYFYTLAQLGITFAGFAAMLMALREMRGKGMSAFHLWVARSYIQSGLVTAISAMTPPLLYGLGLTEEQTWQAASLLIGLPALVMLALAPKDWRANTPIAFPLRLKLQVGLGLLINLALLFNAAGWPVPPKAGPLMLAVSWNLFAFFFQFAESVRFFFTAEDEDG